MTQLPGTRGRYAFALLLAAILAVFGAHPSEAQQPQERPAGPPIIRSIEIDYTGPVTVSKDRILAQMRTKVGEPYSDQVVEQDIRQLYSTGQVNNVRIFGEPEGDGVKVIVAIQTKSVIREIEVDGATKVSAKRLRKEITVRINQSVNEEELQKSRQKIIETYRGRGFNDIAVQFRVDQMEQQKGAARVVFTIDEGLKGAVKRVEFEGNTHFSDRVLRGKMKTRGKTMIAVFDKSGRLDEVQLQQDLESIKQFYQTKGYIDVEVKDVRKERPQGPIVITISVKEGPQYHTGRVTFSGYKATTLDKLSAVVKMKEGSVYSPKGLHDDAKAIADAYGTGGYVDLVVLPEGSPGGSNVINVHYKIEEGNRSFVERINIVGNTRTKDRVIRREVLLAPGDTFNTVRVDVSKRRLDNLGYFAKVETYPEDSGVPGRKDLTIQVEEKRTGSLSFGGGFSTIDQLVVFAELTQGNFDITNWPGFTGGGQKFRTRVQLGTQRRDFVLALTEPYFLDRRLSLGGQLFFSEANYLSSVYDQRNYGVAVELRKPLAPYLYATLGYRLENIEIFNVSSGSSEQIFAQEGTTTKSTILSSLVFDRRDNPMLTRRGHRVSLSPYVAGGFLGGDTQIYGGALEGSQYFHLPKDFILLFNAEAAVVDTWPESGQSHFIDQTTFVNVPPDPPANPTPPAVAVQNQIEISHVPIYDRLYLGGSNNLRGFAFRDVGPRDINGEPIGGSTMARATVELTFPIIEKARGAVFYDMGFVNQEPYDFEVREVRFLTGYRYDRTSQMPVATFKETENLATDFGFGLRLDLPIGPLRLDYGIPINTNGRSSSGRFNFNVGYQF